MIHFFSLRTLRYTTAETILLRDLEYSMDDAIRYTAAHYRKFFFQLTAGPYSAEVEKKFKEDTLLNGRF